MTPSPFLSPINPFSIDRLSPQAHLDLHQSILALIHEQGPAALHLSPHIDTYTALIEIEKEYICKSHISNLRRYLPARHTTDHQLERLISVVHIFYNVVPTPEIEAFLLHLRQMLQEAG